MAEPQVCEVITVAGVTVPVDGGEVENQDIQLLGQVAGLADDRVLAELLRIAPGFSIKAILPYGFVASASANYYPTPGTVIPSGNADGGFRVFPFRAIVGSRTSGTVDALALWRDIRSWIYKPSSQFNAVNGVEFFLTPNASGQPRWDLVYATLAIDVPANPVQRRIKDPNSAVTTVAQVFEYTAQSITINIAIGTPGASPVVPTIPADTGGVSYNIPLAAIHVANGFGAASTVATTDIRDVSPPAPISPVTGATNIRPASGNNDASGTYATDPAFQWSVGAVTRPGPFLTPALVGGDSLLVQIDAATPGHPSHTNGSIVDNSVDWRKRYFKIFAAVSAVATNQRFASDPSAPTIFNIPSGTSFTPPASATTATNDFRMANTMWADNIFGANTASLYIANNASFPSMLGAGAQIGVYVTQSDGVMRAAISATNPGVRVFLWIEASAQMANF
jgi:hypothetical protein